MNGTDFVSQISILERTISDPALVADPRVCCRIFDLHLALTALRDELEELEFKDRLSSRLPARFLPCFI